MEENADVIVNLEENNQLLQNKPAKISAAKSQADLSAIFLDDATKHNFWPKVRGTVFILIGFPIFCYVLYFAGVAPRYVMGILLIMWHVFYFANMAYFVYQAEGLFRVKPRYKLLNHWIKIQLPYRIDEYPRYAIKSISEFSSIRGSMTHLSLFGTGLFTFGSYLSIFLMSADEWSQHVHSTCSAIVCFGAPLGLVWLGWWELNPNDSCHILMHYIGVGLCIGGNIGLGIEVHWNWIFWATTIPFILAFIGWKYVDLNAKLPSDDPKYINRIAVWCLFLEGVVLFSGALAFDIFLFTPF